MQSRSTNDRARLSARLTGNDWSAEWQKLQALRRRMPDARFWDERAGTFSEGDAPESYVAEFLRRADAHPGESVLDMGCGAGDLAIPLAKSGCRVTAADFSLGMLGILEARSAQTGLSGISPIQMSWEDDWGACGLEPESFDVCIASRSLSVSNLEQALLKLDAMARRRVCVTLSTGLSPKTDGRVLSALGLDNALVADHLYAVLMLAQHGIRAEVSFIDSERIDLFSDFEEAYGYYSRMVEESAPFETRQRLDQALSDLREWLPEQLVECDPIETGADPASGSGKLLRMREPRIVSWAFLAWDKASDGDSA